MRRVLGNESDLRDVLVVFVEVAAPHGPPGAAATIAEKVRAELLRRGLFSEDDGCIDHHERHAQAFLKKVREILAEAVKLSPEISPDIFSRVDGLTRDLRSLFRENTDQAERRFAGYVREQLDKLGKEL